MVPAIVLAFPDLTAFLSWNRKMKLYRYIISICPLNLIIIRCIVHYLLYFCCMFSFFYNFAYSCGLIVFIMTMGSMDMSHCSTLRFPHKLIDWLTGSMSRGHWLTKPTEAFFTHDLWSMDKRRAILLLRQKTDGGQPAFAPDTDQLAWGDWKHRTWKMSDHIAGLENVQMHSLQTVCLISHFPALRSGPAFSGYCNSVIRNFIVNQSINQSINQFFGPANSPPSDVPAVATLQTIPTLPLPYFAWCTGYRTCIVFVKFIYAYTNGIRTL